MDEEKIASEIEDCDDCPLYKKAAQEDYCDFNWPGIGSLEIDFGSPKRATLRFNPSWPSEGRSEAAQGPEAIDHPPTPEKSETRFSRRPSDLRGACESLGKFYRLHVVAHMLMQEISLLKSKKIGVSAVTDTPIFFLNHSQIPLKNRLGQFAVRL